SAVTLASQPSLTSPLQSREPSAQASSAQALLRQTVLAAAHTVPQAPQFALSLAKFTQAPSQHVSPSAQAQGPTMPSPFRPPSVLESVCAPASPRGQVRVSEQCGSGAHMGESKPSKAALDPTAAW